MWDKQFCLGIVAIIVLYYLMTRTFSEGLTSLGNKSSIEHVKNMPDIQQMQLINEEIKRATQDMARESALHARLIPLHPVPEIKDKVNEKTTQYLKNISNYMQELERGGASSKMGIMGNFTNSTSKQSNSPFNKLNATSQDKVETLSNKEKYIQRRNNRMTPAELKHWFGSVKNLTDENTTINKNASVKYKR